MRAPLRALGAWCGGHRRGLCCLAVLAALSTGGSPALAAGEPPVFAGRVVLQAPRGGSSVEVTLAKPLPMPTAMTFAPAAMTVVGSHGLVLLVLRAEAEVGGLAPAQVTWGKVRAPEGGGVVVAPSGTNADDGKTPIFEDHHLAAGRYRLYVVADSPVTVDFSLPGSTGAPLHLRPTRRSWSRFVDTAPLNVAGGPAPTSAQGDTEQLTGRTMTFVVLAIDVTAQLGEYETGLCHYQGGPPQGRWLPTCPGGLVVLLGNNAVAAAPHTYVGWAEDPELFAGRWGVGTHYDVGGPVRSVHCYQAWLTY